jgi:predicted ester cyclase
MSEETNKRVVRRFIDEVLNAGNIEVSDDLVAEDFVAHPAPTGGLVGLAGVKEFAAAQRAAAPDWHITIQDIFAEGAKVVVRGFGRGTPQRAYFGIAPSKEPITIPWIAMYRVAGGKIAERWTYVQIPERETPPPQ